MGNVISVKLEKCIKTYSFRDSFFRFSPEKDKYKYNAQEVKICWARVYFEWLQGIQRDGALCVYSRVFHFLQLWAWPQEHAECLGEKGE